MSFEWGFEAGISRISGSAVLTCHECAHVSAKGGNFARAFVALPRIAGLYLAASRR